MIATSYFLFPLLKKYLDFKEVQKWTFETSHMTDLLPKARETVMEISFVGELVNFN